jgi:hypothetical protein
MPKYGYVVVEGPHDVELVYRLLSPHGLARIQQLAALDPFLVPLVPRSFPPDGDLQKRVPVPLFLQSGTHAVAVHSAVGDTRLIQTVEENATLLDPASLTGIGVILDSDLMVSPAVRHSAIRDGLRAKGYSLPDNLSGGTLEDILIDCAQHAYPSLLSTAAVHVDTAFGDNSLSADDMRELRKPAGRNKAIVGSMASILRPGRAIQVSLQDNRWLRDTALALPRVKAVQDFLLNLLELP